MEKLVQLDKITPERPFLLKDYKELAKKIKTLKKLTRKIKKLYKHPQ